MNAGTLVQLPDGREGRVVYHGLDGYGIRWGRKAVDVALIRSGVGNLNLLGVRPPDVDWSAVMPQAMLRDPYPGCAPDLEYVGNTYEVVEEQPA